MNELDKTHLTEETLWEYIDQIDTSIKTEAHLQSCLDCKKKLVEMQRLSESFLALSRDEPSQEFTGIVISNWERTKLVFPWFVSLLATCFLFIFGLSFFNVLQESIEINATFIQTISMVFIVAGYLIYDLRQKSKLVEV